MGFTKYGTPDVLELTEVEIPTPQDDEVLLKVHGASVNRADWRLRGGEAYIARLQLGLREPKDRVLGCDVAGRVEAVGVAGVFTVVPALEVLQVGFGLGELVWIVWLGIVMFHSSRSAAARKLRTFFAVRFGKRVATTQDLTPTRGES